MTPERLAEIRAACEAATPEPWEVAPYWVEDSCLSDVISPYREPTKGVAMDCYSRDADFIALARTAVPELLAENAQLRADLEWALYWLDRYWRNDEPECPRSWKLRQIRAALRGGEVPS